jgi:hypothetical protein
MGGSEVVKTKCKLILAALALLMTSGAAPATAASFWDRPWSKMTAQMQLCIINGKAATRQ